jgi:hypothetical protein
MRPLERLIAALPEAQRGPVRAACDGVEFHAEACWHSHDPAAEAVIGLPGGGPERLVALARALAPAHASRIERWLAATPGGREVGWKVGHHGLQVYLFGELATRDVIAGLTAAEVATQPVAIENLTQLFDQPDLAIVGLELHPDRIEGAIYVSVLRTRHTTAALRDAFGLLVRVVAPDQLDAWQACAPALLDSPRDEIVYVSMSATLDWPWAKLDVGARPLGLASRLAPALGGAALDGVVVAARGYGGTAWSHVGVRFGSSFGPVFYLPAGSRRSVVAGQLPAGSRGASAVVRAASLRAAYWARRFGSCSRSAARSHWRPASRHACS